MASQLAASDLIHEDSRRLVTDETELIDEELDQERELRRQGKQRQYDEDEEEQQDTPYLSHQPDSSSRPSPIRDQSFEYLQTDSKQVKRTKRRQYWQRAAINVFFIASWYFFSSIISVYSQCPRRVMLCVPAYVRLWS